jgi:surfactin synthase thioesterase subunit
MSIAVFARWIAAATGAAAIAALAVALPGHANQQSEDLAAAVQPTLHSAVHTDAPRPHDRRLM